jgi:hypothetical protein
MSRLQAVDDCFKNVGRPGKDAGRKVRIAIDGCESGEGAANGVDCAALTRRLKRILTASGVDHPGALISPR